MNILYERYLEHYSTTFSVLMPFAGMFGNLWSFPRESYGILKLMVDSLIKIDDIYAVIKDIFYIIYNYLKVFISKK